MSKNLTDRSGNPLGQRGKLVRQAILDALREMIDSNEYSWRQITATEIMREVRVKLSQNPDTAMRLPSTAVFYTHFGSVEGVLRTLLKDLAAAGEHLSYHMKLIAALEGFEDEVTNKRADEILDEVLAKGGKQR
jgi:AcrR family transcriptional regulator